MVKKSIEEPKVQSFPKQPRPTPNSNVQETSKREKCDHSIYALVEQKDKGYLVRYNSSMVGKSCTTHCTGCRHRL